MSFTITNNSITNKGTAGVAASCSSVSGGQTKCANYTLTNTTNTLTVNARPTTCTSGSDSKTYDGDALTRPTSGSCTNLVSGHSATFSGHTGSITNAGSTANTFGSVVIKSGSTDVSSNYSITKATGTLTVNQAKTATTGSCGSYTYDGNQKTLASGGSYVSYSNNERTDAGSQNVTVTTDSNHQFSNGAESTTLSCSIAQATPTLTLSSTSGSTIVGSTTSFTEKASVAGKFTNSSASTSVATVSPTSNSSAVSANTNQTVTVTGVSTGSSVVTVGFTPSSSNYKTVSATYTATVNGITRTATFYPNGATLSTPSGCSKNSSTGVVTCSCTTSGSSTSCSVTAPTITRDGYTIVGYNTSSSSTSGLSSPTSNGSVSISSNPSYYAITKKTATATFVKQGTAVTAIGATSKTCDIYNTNTTCSVTTPSITVSSGGTAVGWSTSSSGTSGTSAGNSVSIGSSGATYYSISYMNLTAYFTIGDNDIIGSIGSTSSSCKIWNSSTSCSITMPTMSIASNMYKGVWIEEDDLDTIDYYVSHSGDSSGLYRYQKYSTYGYLPSSSYTLTSSNNGILFYAFVTRTSYNNTNIVDVYKYNASTCVTGEESTCRYSNCMLGKNSSNNITYSSSSTCTAGTIVKYKVNSSTTKYFYVLHDDGSTLTMQQRENTTSNVTWYILSNSNTSGPITALSSLESATSNWSNVNNQTYTAGTTSFLTNKYTGCSSYSNCSTNTYTLSSRTAKARLITLQEAYAVGCTVSSMSCPVWMYNYLRTSTSNGGTQNDTSTYGYWTMSASSSTTNFAWYVPSYGKVIGYNIGNASRGTRAVVVINK